MHRDQRRQIIRQRYLSGELPPYSPGKAFGGMGAGRVCDCCGDVIDQRDIEYEIELPDGRQVLSHIGCWLEWAALTQHAAQDPDVA